MTQQERVHGSAMFATTVGVPEHSQTMSQMTIMPSVAAW
jgi:hypothetical protein